MKFIFPCLLLFLALFISCDKKKDDSVKPILSQLQINGSGATPVIVEVGQILTATVRVSDDQALNQLKFTITPATNNRSITGAGDGGRSWIYYNLGTWEDLRVINLTGKEQTITADFGIPDSIQGYWHLRVDAIDENGNQANVQAASIWVEQTTGPSLSLDNVMTSLGDTLFVSDADSLFKAVANAQSTVGLRSLQLALMNSAANIILNDSLYSLNGESTFGTNLWTTGPLNRGNYFFVTRAYDINGLGNQITRFVRFE
jgi:hypothetical protein